MNQKIVTEWYNDENNIAEMEQWEKGKLKAWEESELRYFPFGAKILDIGCGLAREAFALDRKGFAVTGIDSSAPVIRKAKQLALQYEYDIPFLWFDGKNLPFEDGSFRVIIIWSQTLGLMYGEDYKDNFLKECRRVLRDGGLLSFSGYDHEYMVKEYRDCVKGRRYYPWENQPIYWETFLQDEMVLLAKEAGYTVIHCERGEVDQPKDDVVLHCLCRR